MADQGKDIFEGFDAEEFVAEKVDVNSKAQESEGEKGTIKPLSMMGWDVPLEEDIPLRDWLYGSTYLRGVVMATIAPGGSLKSTLTLAEAMAMASMRDNKTHSALGKWTKRGLIVGYCNLEDPPEEQDRRAAGIIRSLGLDRGAIKHRLLRLGEDETGLNLAQNGEKGYAVIARDMERLRLVILERKIDVLIIDPFVSVHTLSENANGDIDLLVKALGHLAKVTGIAIHLVHHVAKLRGEELTQDSARGASAFVDALRGMRGISRMTRREAKGAGLANGDSHIRVSDLKQNYTKPENADWYEIRSIILNNSNSIHSGDSVAVPVPWTYPNVMDSVSIEEVRSVMFAMQKAEQPLWRSDQSQDWVGYIIADELGLDFSDEMNKVRVKKMLNVWEDSGLLKKCSVQDPIKKSRKRPALEVNSDRIPTITTT